MMKKITFFIFLLMVTIGYSQDPATGPTDPPARNVSDVISFYGGNDNSYTDVAGLTFDSFGGSTIVGNVVLGDGKTVIKYTNHLYHGIGGGSYNVSNMTTLHVDVYSPNFTVFAIKLEAVNGSNVELPVSDPKVQGSWNSYEIDLSAYAAVDLANLKWIVPVTYENPPTGTTLYLDNLYFYRPAVDPNTDATLSDLKIDGNTIAGFLPSKINYDYKVPTGTVVVPQITSATATQAGNGSSATSITQASGIPGNATVLVTAPDGSTTKTYTVSIIEEGPASAATTPPARAVADVKSVYSDAYANVATDGAPTFAGASVSNITISSNNTIKLTAPNPGGGFQYQYFGNPSLDLTSFTHMHIDFYVEGAVQPGQVVQVFLQNFDGGGAFQHNIFYNFDVNALGSGSWISGDVQISNFTNGGLARNNIKQVQVVAAGPTAFGPIYIDNIYFHKNTTLGLDDLEITGLNVYPNPSKDTWTIKTNNVKITSIQVYDILGKNVLSLAPNATEAKINATTLSKGLYFAKVSSETGSSSLKLLKN